MDHLAEAKRRADRAEYVDGVGWAQLSATLAIAHAAIAQAESTSALVALVEQLLKRLPLAETWSACSKRLREEEEYVQGGDNEL